MSRPPPTLARLERWMQAVVIHPAGAEAGVQSPAARALLPRAARDLESVVLPSRSQSSLERLGIYAHMYYARLLEVMTAEYPTTRRLLGETRPSSAPAADTSSGIPRPSAPCSG
jgi:Putative DNA-binding domain